VLYKVNIIYIINKTKNTPLRLKLFRISNFSTVLDNQAEVVLEPTIPMQLKSSMILNIWKISY